MDSPSDNAPAWPQSMVGHHVLHLDTGVSGVVDAVDSTSFNEPTVRLASGHVLLARNEDAWCVLTPRSLALLAMFSGSLNETIAATIAGAASSSPELKPVFPRVLAAILRHHARALFAEPG